MRLEIRIEMKTTTKKTGAMAADAIGSRVITKLITENAPLNSAAMVSSSRVLCSRTGEC